MTVTLSQDMNAFVRRGIESGRFSSESEALEIALRALQSQEALGDFVPGELDSLVEEGLRDFDEGRFEPITPEFWDRIKREGRRSSAQQQASERSA